MQKEEGYKQGRVTPITEKSESNSKSDKLKNIKKSNPLDNTKGAGAKNQSLMMMPNKPNTSAQHVETNIGNITVMTQAKESKGIVNALGHDLRNMFNKGIYNLDSGLA